MKTEWIKTYAKYARDQINCVEAQHVAELRKAFTEETMVILDKYHQRFPKRHLVVSSGMGGVCFLVDGRYVEDYYWWRPFFQEMLDLISLAKDISVIIGTGYPDDYIPDVSIGEKIG